MNSRLVGFILYIFTLGAFAQAPVEVNSPPGMVKTSTNKPVEGVLQRAGSRRFDLRSLPKTPPPPGERVELEGPETEPVMLRGSVPPQPAPSSVATPSAPAPPPLSVFEGLDRFNFGSGSPPDTNGDVGPTYYIQTVNSSIGIFRKTDGFLEAGFSFNTFMSQGNFGNLCDTNNFGDPVVLYDSFEDRWIISDFAFLTDVSGNALAPAYQCIAASLSGNPLTGGWSFYSRQISDYLNDYPKMGIWPDGLYMSANMFTFGAGSSFRNARVWAFNKAQMYAGAPTAQVVSFDVAGGDFTVLPGNARLQTGTPPPGRPNLFISTQLFLNAVTVYKFHVDWDRISLSTFTGPDTPISATSWPTFAAGVPQSGTATLLDSLSNRAMVQNQYSNFGGTESLWVSHTVRRAAGGFAAPRWYEVNVTGGTVNPAIPQAATWDPDAGNVLHRWMSSLALDRSGNMAMGYSTSSATAFPSIAYAGRLASDPVNTFSKTEQVLFTGTGPQTGSSRWGDYSAMTLDPDGCRFWYTNEYANPLDQTFDHRWLTKFGSFAYTECTPFGAGGTISGTVTTNPGGAPIGGATVQLGARTATSDGSGNYSLSVPAGTYPSISATKPGFGSSSAASLAVTDGATTTQNFALTSAPAASCVTDTTQSDFLTGVQNSVDPNASPGDLTLLNAPNSDQANTAGTTTGTGFGTPNWTGQTFIAGVTGVLTKADIQLFCNGCGATPPNLTLSVRNTAAGLPTGADLASVTIAGSNFSSGGTVLFTASFASPPTLTSGTQYALILRPVSVPAGSGYFWIRSSPSTYASGSRVLSADSGGTWSTDTTRDYNFRTYMQTGYAATGNLESSSKDTNPAQNFTPTWSTLSWTGSTPANTALSFQVAASNSPFGPFNFVGPDGTAGTFFTTSPATLSQFNGKRYLRYRSILATTNAATTPTVNDVTTCFSNNPPVDLAISKDDGTTTAAAGGSVLYTITATNAGPGAATNATVSDTFPADETCNWTCTGGGGGSCTASGTGNLADSVNLPVGGSVTYLATCGISLTASGSLSNTAAISGTSAFVFDTVPGNNSATDTDGVVQVSDLTITKTDGVTTATPGGSVTYTITASNAGPSNAPGSTVADTFPASLTCSWTCVGAGGGTCTASGSGNINDTINLPVGSSTTYTASCSVNASATGTLSNTATVTAPAGVTDPTPANNSATDTDTLTPQADLAVTKTDGVTTATPGGSVTYTITASNAGLSNASGATVADTFPASETCTWTCVGAGGGTCTASGSGNINDSVNLPAGGSVTFTASCSISAAATGTVSNTATVAAPAGVTDPTPGNNSATDSDTLTPQAELAITKTDGVTTVAPGGSVTYTITASNAGLSNASGATVADTFPAVETCSWTCVGAGGGTCTASGSGNINDSVNLPAGGSVTFTASCTISASATGTVSNTATVTAPAGVTDPTPGNNAATDSDTLTPQADLAISKTDGVTTVPPGGSVTYTITASNAGPSNASGATVADTFPAAETCTWTCVGAGGGTCTASGSGNINGSVNLPAGGSVTFTASCSIAAAATGTLSNTATVAAPAGVTDPTPGNNSATDTDTIVATPDVALTLSDNRTSAMVGRAVNYIVNVTNGGPGTAVAVVTDALPAGLTDGHWFCIPSAGTTCTDGVGNTLSDTVTLTTGAQVAYVYTATVVAGDGNDQVINTASVAVTNATDPVPGNNSASDTDNLVLFRDNFEGTPVFVSIAIGSNADYATAALRINANLLNALSIVPTAVARGQSANGKTLFTLELARFGNDVALRALTTNERGASERSGWQKVANLNQRLLTFAWQSASDRSTDGYLNLSIDGTSVMITGRSEHDVVTQLWVTVENAVPWLNLIAR